MTPLVTTEWLAGELGANDLRIIDATLFLADAGRHARAEFEAAHIPGAVFLDLDELVDTSNPLPNMLPPAEKFASRMQALGLGDGSRIVRLRQLAAPFGGARVVDAHLVRRARGRAVGRRLRQVAG